MTTTSRYLVVLTLAAVLVSGTFTGSTRAAIERFYDDDPVWTEADTQDAKGVREREIVLTYDLVANLFGKPGDKTPDVPAQNTNTVDEVPDSSWFTNRAGRRPLTPAEVSKGPDETTGPAAGPWTVVSGKSDGVTPGFTIRDSAGQIWFLKFDPPGRRGMATGTEVAVTKLMWALGYHVPENRIATLRRDQLVLDDEASFTPPMRTERLMRGSDIDSLLRRADRDADGSYRVVASKGLEGMPLGGIQFFGTRPDDPNDVVPHEHRRELRGYGTFAAWLNHVDAKATNALDTLVTRNGRSFVRHHLIDFGSALGSGALQPRQHWEGFEYLFEGGATAKGIPSFGFYIRPWRTVDEFEAPSIGRLPADGKTFDPERWRTRVPNPAFIRARPDDKFWAARKLTALTDEIIGAAVQAGQFGDPESEGFLRRVLIERRNAITARYLPAINPVVDPAMDGAGILTFRNAAVDAGVAQPPAGYRVEWFRFDNVSSQASPIGRTEGTGARMTAPAGLPTAAGVFIRLDISATGTPNAAWEKPVRAYFRRTGSEWQWVGFERLPV